jgi:hypothetical protein
VNIPEDLAERVPGSARYAEERERAICRYCESQGFSRKKLKGVISALKSS